MKKEQKTLEDSCRYLQIANFVNSQTDKSKDKIAAGLKHHFNLDEKELESLIRVGALKEYRGIDEHGNGIDCVKTSERMNLFDRLYHPELTIDRINIATALAAIGY